VLNAKGYNIIWFAAGAQQNLFLCARRTKKSDGNAVAQLLRPARHGLPYLLERLAYAAPAAPAPKGSAAARPRNDGA
jgi:hypothetical protein